MSRPKLTVAVGLLTGHTTLRACMFKVRVTLQQTCWQCGDKKDCEHIVCHCPALVCKRYKTLDHMFLKPEDLENMRVNVLVSLQPSSQYKAQHSTLVPSKIAKRHDGTTVHLSLGTIMESLTSCTTTATTTRCFLQLM